MSDSTLVTVPLHAVAHSRAGDKGNCLNLSLISYQKGTYHYLEKQITEKVVKDLFKFRNPTSVKRYDLPLLGAFNFVIDEVLEGGVNNSLCLDGHGKSLSFLLLSLPVMLPRSLIL